jgi:hypothetical protein
MRDMDSALEDTMQINGAIGVPLVDSTSGTAPGLIGDEAFDVARPTLAPEQTCHRIPRG